VQRAEIRARSTLSGYRSLARPAKRPTQGSRARLFSRGARSSCSNNSMRELTKWHTS